jgi:hypothetical protein
METLSWMLGSAIEGGYNSGFMVGQSKGSELLIYHLLFVDDTLFFCGVDLLQIWHLQGVFIWFRAIFWLKINLSKLELVLVGQLLNVNELAGVLGCKVSTLPLSYLGLPLRATFNTNSRLGIGHC